MSLNGNYTWRAGVLAAALWAAVLPAQGGTVGKVIPVGGHAADLALDEGRGVLYVANYTANRIEVVSIANGRVQTSMNVAPNPSGVALSPDGQYLVATHYGNFESPSSPSNAVTVIDLVTGTRQTIAMGAPPLGVAFGGHGRALIVTTTQFLLFNPATGLSQTIETIAGVTAKVLPVEGGTAPAQIVASSLATSGDGLKIFGVLAGGASDDLTLEFQYDISSGRITGNRAVSEPPLGPRVMSVNHDGSLHLAGWTLNDAQGSMVSQFPSPTGELNIGSHVFDNGRGRIYAQMNRSDEQIAVGGVAVPLLQVLDADNLTLRERLRLKENLSGRSVMSRDGRTMYAVSESGVTILPIGELHTLPRVAATAEDVVFRGNFCDRQLEARQITIEDPGGNATAFKLVSSMTGVTVSPSSGVTPATVTIRADPAVFANAKGTTIATIDIVSEAAVNLPNPIRVLINNKEPDQRGMFVNVPGRLVDIVADPGRERFFVLRQDRNEVLVFDGATYAQIETLRTKNTPTQMAVSFDRRWLMVGHQNSQVVSVFDLETLQESAPIRMPFGHYPQSIASSGHATLVASRVAGPVHTIDRVDFNNRVASTPRTLGIYKNEITPETVLAASPNGSSILIAQANGSLMLYSANVDSFTVSRKENLTLGGAYAASNFDQFVAGNLLLNSSLVPVMRLETGTGLSSGFAFVDQVGIRTTAPNASSPGIIQRIDAGDGTTLRSTRMVEAPVLSDLAAPFTRTLAPLASRKAIAALTTSGVTILPWNYDAAVAPPQITKVVNAADYMDYTAPGSLITLIGTNLSPVNQATSTTPLPTALGESCLTVNGVPVPMLFVSSEQINAQLPYQVEGNVTLILRTPGGVSDNVNLTILSAAPSIFRSNVPGSSATVPVITRAKNNQLVTVSNPIHWEDVITIYLTGLGNTSPALEAGYPGGADPLAEPVNQPTVTIGGVRLPVESASVVPGQVGVYAIRAQVPRSVPLGFGQTLSVASGGLSTSVEVRVVD